MTAEAGGRVLVTGAARRIGASICRAVHAAGYDIALHYHRSRADAEALAAELNGQREGSCLLLAADLADPEQLQALCEQAREMPLSGLVNNASVYYPLDGEQATLADWDRIMNSNLRAAWYLSRQLRSTLEERGGSIINIGDSHAAGHSPGFTEYELSKLGLAELTCKLALEFAPGVRVNAVAPGAILWPDSGPESQEDNQQAVLERIPLGALGEPGDIAGAVLFLLAQAPYITGQVLAVDGGRGLLS